MIICGYLWGARYFDNPLFLRTMLNIYRNSLVRNLLIKYPIVIIQEYSHFRLVGQSKERFSPIALLELEVWVYCVLCTGSGIRFNISENSRYSRPYIYITDQKNLSLDRC